MTQYHREVVTGAHLSLVNSVLGYSQDDRLAKVVVGLARAWNLKRVVSPDPGHDCLLAPALDFASEPDSERL